jgi:hypothetical protein
LASTPILNLRDHRVQSLLTRARALASGSERALLVAAHQLICTEVRPVYALDDQQPVSRTLERGRGSCSQRLAALEAVARAAGVPTRVRGLLVDGSFWYPRFPRLRWLVPHEVVLAWPQFRLDGIWVDASQLYGSLDELSARGVRGFANTGGQTLFEALGSTAVDWDGRLCAANGCATFDLSAVVRVDLGHFPSRDALFTAQGQTLCGPARAVADPILGRYAAA